MQPGHDLLIHQNLKRVGSLKVLSNSFQFHTYQIMHKMLENDVFHPSIDYNNFCKVTETIPCVFSDFMKEIRSIKVNEISEKKKKEEAYNILFKYRVILIKFLKQCNCEFSYNIFGIFRFIKKQKIPSGVYEFRLSDKALDGVGHVKVQVMSRRYGLLEYSDYFIASGRRVVIECQSGKILIAVENSGYL